MEHGGDRRRWFRAVRYGRSQFRLSYLCQLGRPARSSDGGNTWTETDATLTALVNSLGGSPSAFYPPLATDPSVAQRVLYGASTIFVSANGMLTWQEQTANQDLTGSCGTSAWALQDIEFASDHTRALALSMQSGPTPFKLWRTTQANWPDQPDCASHVPTAVWVDITSNLGFDTSKTQATGVAFAPKNSNIAYLAVGGFTSQTGLAISFAQPTSALPGCARMAGAVAPGYRTCRC